MTKPISKARFDLYAIGTRQTRYGVLPDEISFWSDLDESVLGVVFRDVVDGDYGWAMLVRDRLGRFRSVRANGSIVSVRRAAADLRVQIAEVSRNFDLRKLGVQGDETNAAIDLLAVLPGTTPNQLHPYFKEVIERSGRAPARAVLQAIAPWLTAADPHFVREFQRHQFDQRLWELFLWAAMRECGIDVHHGEAPDFLCYLPGVAFTIEATTVAPSAAGVLAKHPEPETPAELNEFLIGYMPIKYGSSLTGKLNRRSAEGLSYWEEADAKDKPFVIAVADFHKPASIGEPGSMVYTQSAIWAYLYGHVAEHEFVDGQLIVRSRKMESHSYAGKTIESGFFNLPGAENVSAVLFSNAGTIAKFDRIGVMAGYGLPGYRYMRMGLRYDPDPNAAVPREFMEEVGIGDYEEGWSDELQVFHNPGASIPLPTEVFAGLTQHFFEKGQYRTIYGIEAVLASVTLILQEHNEPGPSMTSHETLEESA